MSTNLSTFVFQDAQMRVIMQDGQPWFVAADVCRALEIINPTDAMGRLDDDERTLVSNEGRQINAVSEAGLYSLVLGSRKPEARAFKRWVTHEVLPSIRKTGGYVLPKTMPEALRLAADLAEKLEAAKPKVEAYDAFLDTTGTYLIRDVAKALPMLRMGQNRIFEALRARGVIIPESTEPYQQFIDAGYFVRVPNRYYDPQHNIWRTTSTTRVTPKGMDFIRRTLGGNQLHH